MPPKKVGPPPAMVPVVAVPNLKPVFWV